MPVSRENGDTKVVIEDRTLLDGIGNTNNNTNGTNINKMAALKGSKKGVCVSLVLVVVIASGK